MRRNNTYNVNYEEYLFMDRHNTFLFHEGNLDLNFSKDVLKIQQHYYL